MAARFFELVAPGERLTFQTFTEAPGGKGKARILHGTFADQRDELARLNAAGHGIFWMVNRGDGQGRKTENVLATRAVFADLDGAPLDPVRSAAAPPSVIVESSKGRYHAYWLVRDLPIDQFSEAQRAIARRFDGDPVVHDLPRIMRVPGFLHLKKEPQLTRLIHCGDPARWPWSELRDRLGLKLDEEGRRTPDDRIRHGSRNDTLLRHAARLVKQGDLGEQLMRRLRTLNATKCDPPLDDAELLTIARSADRYRSEGFIKLPHRLLDDPRFRLLPPPASKLLLLLMRKYDGFNNGNLSATLDDAAPWGFRSPKQLAKAKSELVKEGLVREVQPWRGGIRGERRQCALFELTDLVVESSTKRA